MCCRLLDGFRSSVSNKPKDGQRFLVRVEVQADEPLTLVENWTGLLKQ
jgi:hypothetical protein